MIDNFFGILSSNFPQSFSSSRLIYLPHPDWWLQGVVLVLATFQPPWWPPALSAQRHFWRKTPKLTYQNLLPKYLQGENLNVKDLLSFSRATLFWRLEAQLLIGVDPTVVRLSWRCSQLGNLDLDTYRQMPKIRNMFISSSHLWARCRRGCWCRGSKCTSCPAPWWPHRSPKTSSSTSSSWSVAAREERGWTWPGSTCHFCREGN